MRETVESDPPCEQYSHQTALDCSKPLSTQISKKGLRMDFRHDHLMPSQKPRRGLQQRNIIASDTKHAPQKKSLI
jgi:hypothetical protein